MQHDLFNNGLPDDVFSTACGGEASYEFSLSFIPVEDPDTGDPDMGILLSSIDITGETVHTAFDAATVKVLLKSLKSRLNDLEDMFLGDTDD